MLWSFIFKFMYFILFYSFERGREREWSSSTSSFTKCLQQPWLGHTEGKSEEVYPSVLHGWQAPNYFSHHLLPSRVSQKRSKKLDQKWRQDLISGTQYQYEMCNFQAAALPLIAKTWGKNSNVLQNAWLNCDPSILQNITLA